MPIVGIQLVPFAGSSELSHCFKWLPTIDGEAVATAGYAGTAVPPTSLGYHPFTSMNQPGSMNQQICTTIIQVVPHKTMGTKSRICSYQLFCVPFFNHSPRDSKHTRYRTMYYHTLGKLLFMDIRDNKEVHLQGWGSQQQPGFFGGEKYIIPIIGSRFVLFV